jgi:Arc/MetJ-type ribon-helix-helix transcriptional regulator
MNLEIHNPELMQRVNAHIQAGHFHDTDEVIEKALDALDERTPVAASREPARTVFEQGLGLFGSPEDAALIDEVVSIAYAQRRRPSREQPPAL